MTEESTCRDRGRRIFRYTLNDISVVMGRSVHTVRKDKESGVFRPWEFGSVVEYILRNGVRGVEVKKVVKSEFSEE